MLYQFPAISFQESPVLENFQLHIATGKFTCLLGASGIGKTTVLKALAGLHQGLAPLPPACTYIPQQGGLMPWMTVEQNACLPFLLQHNHIHKALADRCMEILLQVKLDTYARALPQTLSAGMQQRVLLVRALLADQPLILLDEPLSALDFLHRLELQDLLIEYLSGKTVVMVTHDPLEAARMGQHIYVLGGRPLAVHHHATCDEPYPRRVTADATVGMQQNLIQALQVASAA